MDSFLETRKDRSPMGRRTRQRREFLDLLRSQDIDRAVAELGRLPGRGFVNPLRSALCGDERAKWSAVTVMGILTAKLADRDLESARVVMRTFMWNLTEESGGIAWGVPESMAEVMVCHEALASEYAPILVSYAREDGNFLEYEPLQRGVTWGLGRLAQVRPELLLAHDAGLYLLLYLESGDAAVRGLAAWASGLLGNEESRPMLEALQEDRDPVTIYLDRELVRSSVGELARQALARIPRQEA
jgi:hypothetical protein